MKIIEEKKEDYTAYKERNSHDPYSAAVVTYTERWANLMEEAIDRGVKLETIAEDFSHAADIEGITGFMYGCAVSALAAFWIHGEQLRVWHNLRTQIRNEGEIANKRGTVLNPALLTTEDPGKGGIQ